MADLGHLAGLQIGFVQFLQTGVIQRNHQRFAALFRNIKLVNAAFFLDYRSRLSVHSQRIQVGAAFTGGQMIEGIAAGLHFQTAAVPAVTADAAVHIVLFLADDGQFTGRGVHLIDPCVFIQAVTASFSSQHQQAVAHCNQIMCIKTGILPNLSDFSGRDVQRIQEAVVADGVRFKRIAQEINGVAHHFKSIGLEKRVGQTFAAAVCRIVYKQCTAQFVGDAAAIAPERNLVKDLIVFFLFTCLVRVGPFLRRHLRISGTAGVNSAHDKPFAVAQAAQLLYCKRKGECRQCFAAGHVQTVKAGKLFACLLAFLLGCRTDCRKQNMGLIFPDKLAFFAQCGQLTQSTVIHPQSAFIAVFFLVADRNDKRCTFAARCIPNCREKTIIQKICQFKLFHLMFIPSEFCCIFCHG